MTNTKRDIERWLDDIESSDGPNAEGLPEITLRDVFAILNEEGSAEWVECSEQILRVGGEPYYVPDSIFEVCYQSLDGTRNVIWNDV